MRNVGKLLRQDNDLVTRNLLLTTIVHKIHLCRCWLIVLVYTFDQLLDFDSVTATTVKTVVRLQLRIRGPIHKKS